MDSTHPGWRRIFCPATLKAESLALRSPVFDLIGQHEILGPFGSKRGDFRKSLGFAMRPRESSLVKPKVTYTWCGHLCEAHGGD